MMTPQVMANANTRAYDPSWIAVAVPRETTEWLGLIVDEVDQHRLEWVARTGYTRWRDLPTEMVKLPVDDINKVAVVSWRWDLTAMYPWEPRPRYSRNILSALIYAKEAGIRHLFIDVVSIDQRLTGDDLLRQVLGFTSLYRTIPVIAAYDTISEDLFSVTTRRPWISFEIQAYQHNPTKIVCVKWRTSETGSGESMRVQVSHPSRHDYAATASGGGSSLPQDEPSLRFSRALRYIWQSSFTLTISLLLDRSIEMGCVWDLKYVLPEYAPVFLAAESKNLSPSDVLLTAAILLQADLDLAPRRNPSLDPTIRTNTATLSRYLTTSNRNSTRWLTLHAAPGLCGRVFEHADVVLGSTTVARWAVIDVFNLFDSYVLKSLDNAERVICFALGMTSSEFEAFGEFKKDLRSRRQSHTFGATPKVEVRGILLGWDICQILK